jgi:hypothetical protein
MSKMKIQNLKNLKKDVSKLHRKGKRTGVSNHDIDEPIPSLEVAPCEKVFKGKNNAFIILGRDRPTIRSSGYGGQGGTQCGRIDLIAGLASSYPGGVPDKDTIVNPNFGLDASRIYISQRAHIDKWMGVSELDTDRPEGRAAIAIKSDQIRIHGRNDIKIMTGRGRFSGKYEEKNSNGGVIEGVGGIHLIAGNSTKNERGVNLDLLDPSSLVGSFTDKLQPLVRGHALELALEDLADILGQVLGKVGDNSNRIMQITTGVTAKGTPSTPAWAPFSATILSLTPMDKAAQTVIQKQIDLWKTNYLYPAGQHHISSKYNKTT